MYRPSRASGEANEWSISVDGREILLIDARRKRRLGDKEPSMCR